MAGASEPSDATTSVSTSPVPSPDEPAAEVLAESSGQMSSFSGWSGLMVFVLAPGLS